MPAGELWHSLRSQLEDRPATQRVILALALHRLLSHIEKDLDGFVLRNLPASVQHFVRHNIKRPADAIVDLAVAMLPLMQPHRLRIVPCTTIALTPGCSLDVFKPSVSSTPAPVLLFVHGGIWTLGNRQQYRALGQRLAAEGFVGVIVGYQTWPQANATQQARQVQAALRHCISHAAEWGGDASRVFLSGQSSGANVSALALLLDGGVRCAGFVGMAGPYDAVEHYAYESRRGVQDASMLRAACEPLAAHSPTLLVRGDGGGGGGSGGGADGGGRSGAVIDGGGASSTGAQGRRPSCSRVLLLHGEQDATVPASSSALFALAVRSHPCAHASYFYRPAELPVAVSAHPACPPRHPLSPSRCGRPAEHPARTPSRPLCPSHPHPRPHPNPHPNPHPFSLLSVRAARARRARCVVRRAATRRPHELPRRSDAWPALRDAAAPEAVLRAYARAAALSTLRCE